MSKSSKTYSCSICTYIQSIDTAKCEMCETPNSFRSKSKRTEDFAYDDTKIACPACTFVNGGRHIRVCEMCGHEFDVDDFPTKKFRTNKHDNDDDVKDSDDNHYDDKTYETPMSQNKEKKQKSIEAVEKPMNDAELRSYYNEYINILKEQRQQKKLSSDKQLHEIILKLFHSLQYKNEQSEGQLVFPYCQICYDQEEPVITMNACGHRVICPDDFHQYLSTRIRDSDLLPWIPCPAEVCSVPCDAKNIIEDGRLTHAELLSFITTYMLKKLSRNENFITCIQCQQGGFLQFGEPRKQEVTCQICNIKQTIEKGTDGDLDITFKQMIQSGHIRECPTCRLLTLKEKGLCNVIECAKCGIWWNWRTREQGHNGKDLKQRARTNGTLWEPGELWYQQDLERNNPAEFKALLERNGIKYDPHYVRGGWNED
ncbi:unnamed protein product [Rotaria socialis]|uniref:RanBP2-type domain-containing protein n=1 Tax=Rotaria socialis TaxID=392032 RepID=A0A817Z5K7_9BILA|nr:unnamed protein product [Rotaria socialis]CAF3459641.1 unnamed protein product [Rotaria socialis]CAF3624145.1 unnamed protein product [Rotaria socialis]CAF4285041.1 unnamed protein product [Rotaria socialis]CAF4399449.1 unnamed protein product [Rotaria socialis]